ncbi:hypothetical protein PTTG_27740 [Puccinia triticina 1-1 BBBD Race 1]|uniref:Uncharacterized protein n=1 Tax=Puccinia triticina (isolate 1-1 / race 1 (BBBD)) TaxID=630390 RepID=A0A180GHG5_PUCT1|nr:hypothetical protein PTTG_27740 [Puccinia triticina 1-1 BBBD Race 1]
MIKNIMSQYAWGEVEIDDLYKVARRSEKIQLSYVSRFQEYVYRQYFMSTFKQASSQPVKSLDDGEFNFKPLDLDIQSAIVKHIGSQDIVAALDVIDELRNLRVFVAEAIGEVFKSQISQDKQGTIQISEDLEELIHIQDLLLPHVEKEVKRLGGRNSITSHWVQEEDIPHLIYFEYGSSPIEKITQPLKHTLSYQDFLHLKIRGKVPGKIKFLEAVSNFLEHLCQLKWPVSLESKARTDLVKRLNLLLHNFGSFEIEKAADFKDIHNDRNIFRLQNSILKTVHFMYKRNLMTEEDYTEFFKNKKTLENSTIGFFFDAYENQHSSHNDYLNFPSKYVHYSLGKNAFPYQDMTEVLDSEGKRRAPYGLLKLNFITDDRFNTIAAIKDSPEKSTDNELEDIQEEFSRLNINDNFFKKDKLVGTLESKLATDHLPDQRSEELNMEIQKAKNHLTDIAKLFVKIGDLKNIKGKEIYRNILFLILDFVTENYGKDLLEEERIGGNFMEKFKAMSYSSGIRARLQSVKQDLPWFGNIAKVTLPSPTLEQVIDFSDKIKILLKEQEELNLSAKGSELKNYMMVEEINDMVYRLTKHNNLKLHIDSEEEWMARYAWD